MRTFFIIITLLIGLTAKAQTNETEAKAAYLLAEESYGKGEYKDALTFIESAKKSLGSANSKLLYLQIQVEQELAKDNPAANNKILALISEFEKTPDIKTFNEDKILEIAKTKLKLRAQVAKSNAELELQKKKEQDEANAAEDLKKKQVAVGGIIVYEKDGHGLVMAEFDINQATGGKAKKACDELVLNGFDDWYLPTMEELRMIYENCYKKGIGQLKNEWYLTSKRGFLPSVIEFYSGVENTIGLAVKGNVRPVRKF